jgi:hypothetical protein
LGKPDPVALRTDLSPDECLRRLHEAADPPQFAAFSLSGYKGSKSVIAKLTGTKIKLWKRRYHKNSFAPFFFGALVPDGSGTRIEGHFGIDPFVKIFLAFWLGVFLGGVAAITARFSQGIPSGDLAAIVIPFGMILFGLAVPKLRQRLGRSEAKDLLEFLQTTLATQPVEAEFTLSGRAIENKPL